MQVSGFTIVRNARIMGYPIVEAIKSVLPLVDEFIVGLGPCEDDTLGMIQSIGDPKIHVFKTDWSPKVSGGKILSEKTNEALMRCRNNWCIYIQADEILHEVDYPNIRAALEKHDNSPEVEGLLFRYVHFYGGYDVIATSRKWYRYEVRAVKKNSGIQSWNDAQGFRVNSRKPKVAHANARVYHYGWVKPPIQMGEKKKRLDQLWHGNKKDSENESFDFKKSYGLRKFTDQHPQVMDEKVRMQNWKFNYKMRMNEWTLQDINCFLSDCIEKLFNYRIGEYKNYCLVKGASK